MDPFIMLALAVIALHVSMFLVAIFNQHRPFWRGYLDGWALPLTWLLGRRRK